MEQLAPIQGARVDEQFVNLLTQALFPTIVRGRELAVDLSNTYYSSVAPNEAPNSSIREYTPEMLEEGIRQQLLAPNRPTKRTSFNRNDLGKVAAVGEKHVQDASRRQMMSLVFDDDDAKGWARIPNLPSCAFCITLASRGPRYKTFESAGGMTDYHINCDCRVVPVFNLNNWEGRHITLQAVEIYRAATKKYGVDINSVRKYLADLEADEKRLAA